MHYRNGHGICAEDIDFASVICAIQSRAEMLHEYAVGVGVLEALVAEGDKVGV